MNAKLMSRNIRNRIAWARYNSNAGVRSWGGPRSRHLWVETDTKGPGYVSILQSKGEYILRSFYYGEE